MLSEKTVFIKTYGCQMNFYDSERMEDIMAKVGFKAVEEYAFADVIILNTCHIREKASEKIYSELGRIKPYKEERAKAGKKTIIAVAGCVAQAEGDEVIKRAPYVDIVVGSESYHHLPDMVFSVLRGAKAVTELDFAPDEKFDKLGVERNARGASAFVTIQEGCDKFCTFCVVPYTRGAEFSRNVAEVLAEVRALAKTGAREVMLLGQNVNAYHGMYEGKEMSLAGLIDLVAEVEGIERIRYVTSHPNNVTDDLIEVHGRNPKLMPYLHLPVQAGSNAVLKAMNRKHTRQEYIKLIERFRAVRPDICLSSDFIVGFPGETEEDFEQTIALVEQVGFQQSYSFKYSPRPGTPAALKEQISEEVASRRLQRLQKLLAAQQYEYNSSFLGKTLNVLFEASVARSNGTQVTGKSEYLQAVSVSAPEFDITGKILPVKITSIKENSLFGELCPGSLVLDAK